MGNFSAKKKVEGEESSSHATTSHQTAGPSSGGQPQSEVLIKAPASAEGLDPSSSHATASNEAAGSSSDDQPYSKIVIEVPASIERVVYDSTENNESDESFVFIDHTTKRRTTSVSSAEDAMIWSIQNSGKGARTLSGESAIKVDSENDVNKQSDSSSKQGKENPSPCCSKDGKENPSPCCSKGGKENPSPCCSKDGKENPSPCCSKDGKENANPCCLKGGEENPNDNSSKGGEEDPTDNSSKDGKENPSSCCAKVETENPQKDLDQAVFGTALGVETHSKLHFDQNHSPNITSNSEPKSSSLSSKIRPSSDLPDGFSPHEDSKRENQHWVKVTGSGLTLSDAYEIFSAYGCIRALAETTDALFIKFTNWFGATNVLNDAKNIKETYNIEPLVVGEAELPIKDPGRREMYFGLPSFVLVYLRDYNELLKTLHMIKLLTNDNVRRIIPKIQQVCDYIRSEVGNDFPQLNLLPFGSNVLGSLKIDTPIDIFVDVGNMFAGCHRQSNEDQVTISKEIRKLLSKDDITWHSPEESPIGIFSHKSIGVKCNLSFNNGLGVRSTQLLRVFMDYDERFRVLYFMIDVWSKDCSVQDAKNGMNAYILATLVVFYLQNPPVSVLPSVDLIRTGRPVIVKGWDCSFTEDATTITRNECSESVNSLLRGFFFFYKNYDWKRVICPAIGRSLDRTVFSAPSLPFPDYPVIANYCSALCAKHPDTHVLDVNTCMCVQDFFNLSENIAKGVSPDILLRFRASCSQSYQMLYSLERKVGMAIEDMYLDRPLNDKGQYRSPNGNIPSHWEGKNHDENVMMPTIWENEHEPYCRCEHCRLRQAQWPGSQQNFQTRHGYQNYDHRGGYRYRYPDRGAHNGPRRIFRRCNDRVKDAYDAKQPKRSLPPRGKYDRQYQNLWQRDGFKG